MFPVYLLGPIASSSFRLESVWGRRVDEMRREASVCHMKERNASDASEWKMLVELSDQHARSREISARLNESLVRKRMRTPNIQRRYRKTDRCLSVSLHAYSLNHLCVHSVVMNQLQKRALESSLILALMFLHID